MDPYAKHPFMAVEGIFRKCYFCGENNEVVLEDHHLVPKRLEVSFKTEQVVTLCANCHKKVHSILRELGIVVEPYITIPKNTSPETFSEDDIIKNKPHSLRDKLKIIVFTVTKYHETHIEPLSFDILASLVSDFNITPPETSSIVNQLFRDGLLYEGKNKSIMKS